MLLARMADGAPLPLQRSLVFTALLCSLLSALRSLLGHGAPFCFPPLLIFFPFPFLSFFFFSSFLNNKTLIKS
jgi:hypothetical protein